MRQVALVYRVIRHTLPFACVFLIAVRGEAQIQVDLKFKRVQYIAYEPVVATLAVTNLAGRDVELRDENGQSWFGFEITTRDGQLLAPTTRETSEPLKIESGKTVTRKINLTPAFPIHDRG